MGENPVSMHVAGALPVKLVSFNGKYINQEVRLDWATSQEINTSHYLIQRSGDGINFEDIGNVSAKGNSTLPSSYYYTDQLNDMNQSKLFYRLEMIDKDGNYEYSSVISVNIKSNRLFTISPNPAKDILNIKGDDIIKVEVLGVTGNILIAQENRIKSVVQINIAHLSAGVYLVRITTKEGEQQTNRFLVR